MNPTSIEVLVLTVSGITDEISAYQLVGFDGGSAGENEKVLGIAKTDGKVGDTISVLTFGVHQLKAGNNIAAGDDLYSNANGLPVSGGTANPFGVALTGGGAGDVIDVLIS